MTEQYKDIIRRYYEEIWNQSNMALIPELVHENVSFKGSLGATQRGLRSLSVYMDFIHAALGDYHSRILDMAAEGNKVYARIQYSGIHRGELFGYAATEARIAWEGVAVFTFVDDKISDIWVLGDINGVMKQLSRYMMDFSGQSPSPAGGRGLACPEF